MPLDSRSEMQLTVSVPPSWDVDSSRGDDATPSRTRLEFLAQQAGRSLNDGAGFLL